MLRSDSIGTIELDVSELEPPQPLVAIFAALVELPPEHLLNVRHRRQPFPLYDLLAQTGFQYHCQAVEDYFQIQIWPTEQANVEALTKLVKQAPNCS
ncbi:MAG: DUF2249 domain-containing protein [Halopseudomonas sp.]